MKLFFIGWTGKDLGIVKVVEELKNQGHEILYWTGLNLDVEVDKSKFPNTIFHDHFDAWNGILPKELADNDFLPPGEEFLNQLSEAESIVLTMMNKRFENMPVSERKQLYYALVRYWHGVLQKFKPDVILYNNVPHAVYDYVAYSIAKLLKIKILMLDPSWVSDRLTLIEDYKNGCEAISEALAKNVNKHFQLSDLSEDLQEYYRLQTKKLLDTTPIFVRHTKSRYSGLALLIFKLKLIRASIKDLTIFRKIYGFFKKLLGKNIIKEYRSVQQEPDFAKNFVYFPLQYQPERTSSPQGGIFSDQILMVEFLASALPDDWLLYVKEHPLQWTLHGLNYTDYRYPGYYQAIAGIPRVRIVPAETSTYHLSNAARAVATIAGTAGLEAVFRLKPVLVFGYFWYQDFPGMFKVRDLVSCRKALEAIKNGFSISPQQIIDYLGVFDKVSFHGYVDADGTKVSKLTPEENTAGILNILMKEL